MGGSRRIRAWNSSRAALQARNRSAVAGSASSGANAGAKASTAARSTGNRKQNGSIASNRTGWPARVKRQFMVKVNGDQSVSTTPVRGAMASFCRFGDPPTQRFQPGGVRKIASTWKVSTPWPNSDTGARSGSAPGSWRMVRASTPAPPSQTASKPQGFSTSHPWALAMFSGRQR